MFVAAFAIGSAHAVTLIALDFRGTMTDVERQTFVDAADFWNGSITGYDFNGMNGQESTHSLVIIAEIKTIDGAGGILGNAGPQQAVYYDRLRYGNTSALLGHKRE